MKYANTNTRRALRIGIVMLAIAALLLCSTLVTGVGAGIAVAQEYPQQPSMEYGEGETGAQGEAEAEPAMDDNDDDVPVKVVYRGYGFALNADGTGTEFHALPLRVNIIRVRQLEPMRIRELIGQNKSIDEIRGEIMEKACAPTYQGYMQFAETHYKLVNITVNVNTSNVKESLAVNNLAIDADIMVMVPVPTSIPMPMHTPDVAEAKLEPTGNGNENGNASAENLYQSQGQDRSAGNISLNVLNFLGHENSITIGEGKLAIQERGEDFQFQYHVLLRSER
jgi:hypothetical protein